MRNSSLNTATGGLHNTGPPWWTKGEERGKAVPNSGAGRLLGDGCWLPGNGTELSRKTYQLSVITTFRVVGERLTMRKNLGGET